MHVILKNLYIYKDLNSAQWKSSKCINRLSCVPCRLWEWWLKSWENVGMLMERPGWRLCGLRKHCHSSVNRKASKCNPAALAELYFFFRSAPGFHLGGQSFYLTEREQKEIASFCSSLIRSTKNFPGFLGTQDTAIWVLSVHYERFFPRTVTNVV